MGSYMEGVKTASWLTPDGYDGRSSLADPIPSPWDQPSISDHYAQPVQQSNSDLYPISDTLPQYPQEDRYGSSFSDASSFLPALTDSPSVSSGSSIGTPSGRSYQSANGSYFPGPPSRKNTAPYPIQEDDVGYPAIGDNNYGLDFVGGRFAKINLEDSYSGRIDPEGHENANYRGHRGKPREMTREEHEAAIEQDVDNFFDRAEATATADEWPSIGPPAGISANYKGENVAFRAIHESERINGNLRGIATILADFRRKMKRSRPSRKSSSSSKHTHPTSSERDVYYGKAHKTDRDRDWDRHRQKK